MRPSDHVALSNDQAARFDRADLLSLAIVIAALAAYCFWSL
jgi:hypothetical protein